MQKNGKEREKRWNEQEREREKVVEDVYFTEKLEGMVVRIKQQVVVWSMGRIVEAAWKVGWKWRQKTFGMSWRWRSN